MASQGQLSRKLTRWIDLMENKSREFSGHITKCNTFISRRVNLHIFWEGKLKIWCENQAEIPLVKFLIHKDQSGTLYYPGIFLHSQEVNAFLKYVWDGIAGPCNECCIKHITPICKWIPISCEDPVLNMIIRGQSWIMESGSNRGSFYKEWISRVREVVTHHPWALLWCRWWRVIDACLPHPKPWSTRLLVGITTHKARRR